MEATRSSVLSRVRNLDDAAGWKEFDRLYRPMLVSYARQHGLHPDEAEEVAQHCLTEVVGQIKRFERQSTFRGWLRVMVDHKVCDLLSKRGRCRRADIDLLKRTPAPDRTPEKVWDQIWNKAHLTHCVEGLRADFAEHTVQAFSMYVLQNVPIRDISRRLGMTPNRIYVAKSRVLARLRERLGDTIGGLFGAQR